MEVHLTGNHVDLSDRLRNTINTKLSKLERHYEHITTVNMILTRNKLDHRAEATVHVGGKELFADAVANNMNAAIDSLVDKLDRQVIRHKEKSSRHRSPSH